MTDTVNSRFFRELNSFYLITLMNVIFGALAIAFGVQYMVSSVLSLADGGAFSLLRMATAAFSMAGFGLGLSWIISSVKILDGFDDIRSACKAQKSPVQGEVTTRGIIRMIAHYRRNKKPIRIMILVCTPGGYFFLALGIFYSIEFFSFSPTSGTVTLNSALLIPPVLLAISIGIVSLLSSFYFARFSKAWDVREGEISRLEQVLADTLEPGPR